MAYNISSGVVSSGIKLEYDEMNVSAGGLISSTYILESGTLYISSGGVASTTVLSDFKQSSGEIYVLDGGTADILNVSGGKVYIQAGGKVTNAGVNGGLVEVAADGVLSVGGFASGARMHLYTDAALYAVNIVSGAIVNGFTLQNAIGFGSTKEFGWLLSDVFVAETDTAQLYASQAVDKAANYGAMHIYNGGVVNSALNTGNMHVSNGGAANNTEVNQFGSMVVYSGGAVNSTSVNAQGSMFISSGGIAINTVVNEGGDMYVSSGGIHRGTLTITGTGRFSVNQGGYVDFTVADVNPNNEYLINDISAVKGTPIYTITVKADQAVGTYNLAKGANNFSGQFTIGSSLSSIAAISVNGETVSLGNTNYTLTKQDGNLNLIVSKKASLAAPKYTVSPSSGWTSGNVVISVVFDSKAASNEYSDDNGVNWNAATDTITVSSNGTVMLRSKDANGFEGPVTSVVISNIDKEKPVVTVAAETPENYVSKITITVSASDDASGIAKIEYSLDNKTWNELKGSAYDAVDNGTYYFRATDKSGMVSDTQSVSVSKIDTDKPTLTITGNPTEITESDVVLEVTATDKTGGLDKVEYSVNGAEYQAVALDAQGKGSVTVSVNGIVTFRAYDKAGQYTEEVVVIDKIEKEPPVVTVTADHTSWTNAAFVTVSATATDDASGIKSIEYWDGTQWIEKSSVQVSENNTVVKFRAQDNSGKYSEEESFTVDFIDRIAPQGLISGNTNRVVKSFTLAVTASDKESGIASVKYSVDNKNWTEGTSLTVVSNGTVYFRIEDNAGNVTMLEEEITRIDDVKPSLVITGNPVAYQEGDVTLYASASDNLSPVVRIAFSLDNMVTWQEYTDANPCVVTKNQTVYFAAVDSVGNITERVVVVDKIDRDDPIIRIAGYSGAWTNQDIVLTAIAGDESSLVVKTEYSIGDSGVWIIGNEVTVSDNTTIHFRATDAVGHTTVVSKVVNRIDKVAPQAPQVSADITAWTSTDVVVSAVFADDSAKNEYSINGSEYQLYTSDVVMEANGSIEFRSTDVAGNVSTSTYNVANIDKTAPVLSISGISTKITRRPVTVTANVSDNLSGIVSVEYSFSDDAWHAGNTVTMVENGVVTFRVTDAAGNVTVSSAFVNNIVYSKPDSNLLDNGTSQIAGFDAQQGKVGFIAVDGNTAPQWQGVWEWSGSDVDTWRVAAVGNFAGTDTENDGILLHNLSNNTLAAWTDLGKGDYGYVTLGTVDGDFSVVGIVNIGGAAYDDVLVKDGNGSFGVVIDGTSYYDIWHVNEGEYAAWEFYATGDFGKFGSTLIAKNRYTNQLAMWANNDITFESWDWSVKTLGFLGTDLEFAAVGDFMGDGIDDIIVRDVRDGSLWMWDDGNIKTSHWIVTPDAGFKVEAVGDYNGDGMDDILVREYNTGWGGLGYYAVGSDVLWNDLNARIETDLESKFAVIA